MKKENVRKSQVTNKTKKSERAKSSTKKPGSSNSKRSKVPPSENPFDNNDEVEMAQR